MKRATDAQRAKHRELEAQAKEVADAIRAGDIDLSQAPPAPPPVSSDRELISREIDRLQPPADNPPAA